MNSQTTFLELVEQHQQILHKICRLYRDTEAEREDLFQDMMYQLWKSYPGYRAEARFATWMYRIALSTAIARFRKPGIETTRLKHDNFAEDKGENPQQEALYAAIRHLNEIDRALLSLYLDEYSYEEMAEIMGISLSNVGVKLNRIRQKLKQRLNQ